MTIDSLFKRAIPAETECDTSEWEERPVSARPPKPVPVEQPKEQVDWDKYKRFMRQFK